MTGADDYSEAVSAPANHSARDADIAGRLVSAYALSEELGGFGLRVEVRDAIVSLSGTVDDKLQRDLAAAIACEIDDVREVRCRIRVESPEACPTAASDQLARRLKDASLAARERTRLLRDGDTCDQDILIAACDGLVTLRGSVSSAAIRDLAAQLIAGVGGVYAVQNQSSASSRRSL